MTLQIIPSHRLKLPTLFDVRNALQDVLGAHQGNDVWHTLRNVMRLSHQHEHLSEIQIHTLAMWLIARKDLARIVGCSLCLRLLTFQQLKSRLAPDWEDIR